MTEEQKEIVLLGSRYEIMNRYVDLSNADQEIVDGIAKAMQHYADLFHEARTSKLHQSTVSGSGCDNIWCEEGKVNVYGNDWQYCPRCADKQTVR